MIIPSKKNCKMIIINLFFLNKSKWNIRNLKKGLRLYILNQFIAIKLISWHVKIEKNIIIFLYVWKLFIWLNFNALCRRLEGDRFFTSYYNEETYTKKGLEWVNTTESLKDVIDRHHPQMTNKWMNSSSAFSVWDSPSIKHNPIPCYLRIPNWSQYFVICINEWVFLLFF